MYFLNALVTYGVYLWLPRILRDASGFSGFTLSAITAVPFVAALVAMVLVGRHSDQPVSASGTSSPARLTAAVGLVLAVWFQASVPLLVLSFTLSQIGQRSVMSVFWAIPPIFLGGTAAAAGIAMINASATSAARSAPRSWGGCGKAPGPTREACSSSSRRSSSRPYWWPACGYRGR